MDGIKEGKYQSRRSVSPEDDGPRKGTGADTAAADPRLAKDAITYTLGFSFCLVQIHMQITKEELLKELHDFRPSAKLILRPEDIPAGIKPPPKWEPVISKPFGSFNVEAWPEWDLIVKKAQNIGRFLKSILRFNSVYFDQRRSLLYLLYVYTSHERDINFYAGRPSAIEPPEKVGPFLKRFPKELRHFYEQLHDGWTF